MMMTAVSWDRVIKKRNRYACSPLLVTCVILRRLSSPCRWRDMKLLFGRHGGQLSKMFWEGIEQMLETRVGLITGPIQSSFVCNRAPVYADAIKEKCHDCQIVLDLLRAL